MKSITRMGGTHAPNPVQTPARAAATPPKKPSSSGFQVRPGTDLKFVPQGNTVTPDSHARTERSSPSGIRSLPASIKKARQGASTASHSPVRSVRFTPDTKKPDGRSASLLSTPLQLQLLERSRTTASTVEQALKARTAGSLRQESPRQLRVHFSTPNPKAIGPKPESSVPAFKTEVMLGGPKYKSTFATYKATFIEALGDSKGAPLALVHVADPETRKRLTEDARTSSDVNVFKPSTVSLTPPAKKFVKTSRASEFFLINVKNISLTYEAMMPDQRSKSLTIPKSDSDVQSPSTQQAWSSTGRAAQGGGQSSGHKPSGAQRRLVFADDVGRPRADVLSKAGIVPGKPTKDSIVELLPGRRKTTVPGNDLKPPVVAKQAPPESASTALNAGTQQRIPSQESPKVLAATQLPLEAVPGAEVPNALGQSMSAPSIEPRQERMLLTAENSLSANGRLAQDLRNSRVLIGNSIAGELVGDDDLMSERFSKTSFLVRPIDLKSDDGLSSRGHRLLRTSDPLKNVYEIDSSTTSVEWDPRPLADLTERSRPASADSASTQSPVGDPEGSKEMPATDNKAGTGNSSSSSSFSSAKGTPFPDGTRLNVSNAFSGQGGALAKELDGRQVRINGSIDGQLVGDKALLSRRQSATNVLVRPVDGNSQDRLQLIGKAAEGIPGERETVYEVDLADVTVKLEKSERTVDNTAWRTGFDIHRNPVTRGTVVTRNIVEFHDLAKPEHRLNAGAKLQLSLGTRSCQVTLIDTDFHKKLGVVLEPNSSMPAEIRSLVARRTKTAFWVDVTRLQVKVLDNPVSDKP